MRDTCNIQFGESVKKFIKKFIYLKALREICPRFFEPPRETEINWKNLKQIPRNFFLTDKHNTLKNWVVRKTEDF